MQREKDEREQAKMKDSMQLQSDLERFEQDKQKKLQQKRQEAKQAKDFLLEVMSNKLTDAVNAKIKGQE